MNRVLRDLFMIKTLKQTAFFHNINLLLASTFMTVIWLAQ
jgi:hypothetical protein